MARAFCSFDYDAVEQGSGEDQFVMPVKVLFVGADLSPARSIDHDAMNVELLFADSIESIQAKVVDAVIERASGFGYNVGRAGCPRLRRAHNV